jgi:16S rRNA (cytosine967-C5)-methyltransferase
MSVAANQQRVLLRLLGQLRPHWRRDLALPARIQSLLAAHREFGSRDRRLYRELIYTTLRYLPWIEPLLDPHPEEAVRRLAWLAADLPATRPFRTSFAIGEPPAGDKTELLPAWFLPHCPEIFRGDELETQMRRAPLWLRLQADAAGEALVEREFDQRGWRFRRSPLLPGAMELMTEAEVTASDAWRDGRIEIQDLGSQLILAAVGIEAGGSWLDACAGAGGKSLQLAHLLGASGRVDAHDVRAGALKELQARAMRAGVPLPHPDRSPAGTSLAPRPAPRHGGSRRFASILTTTQSPEGSYDGVLVDAPCSGSGTWRRAPHLKWVTTEAHVARAAERQRTLLQQFCRCVRAGGRLVYATCSLSRRENEEAVAAFLTDQPEFEVAPLAHTFGAVWRDGGLTILPALHNTDGFFVASMRRR